MRVQCPECDAGLKVSAADDGKKIECPRCGEVFRCRLDDEDEDDRPRRSRKGRRDEAGESGNSKVLAVGGGVAAAAVAVGVIVWVIATRPKPQDPKPADNAPQVAAAKGGAPVLVPAPVRPVPPPVTQPPARPGPAVDAIPGPAGGPAEARPGTVTPAGQPAAPPAPPEVAELGDLFGREVSSPLPTRRLAKLEKAADEPLNLDVPTFYSLRTANKSAAAPVPKAAKLSKDEVKAATAFIKVEAGEFSGSGSGFLIGSFGGVGLVATNHHVIDDALKRPAPGAAPHKITVVFNSGRADEYSLEGKPVAVDPIADLAVLRVQGRHPAKYINPMLTPPKLEETLPVIIYGFPFGSQLAATDGGHPTISVNTGTVSSLRTDRAGKLEQVQISGPINPGNSGGPITDADGRLVGVAVATISGSGLGFAVPVNELIALIEGKLLGTLFIPTALDGGVARFKVLVPVMDPFGQVETVYLRYWAGEGERPKAVKSKAIGYAPIKPARQLNLAVTDGPSSLQIAVGDLELPADATRVVFQVASETRAPNKATAASPPVTYELTVAEQPTGRDARPFGELAAHLVSTPDGLAGQVLVVRGKVLSPPSSRAPVQELAVADLDGRRPAGVRFVADRETAAQFDEVEPDHQGLDARLTCVVGTRGPDGRVPVRVARVDFLDEHDRPVKSIPGPAKDDKLAALNRDPGRFAGQSLDVKAEAALATSRRGGPADDLVVVFPNLRRPRNLQFATTPGLTARLAEEKFRVNGLYKVRLGVTVAAPASPDAQARVTVRRIEILDAKDDRVLKTIE
jgi:predicted Zn finger-like uncharacterized protein